MTALQNSNSIKYFLKTIFLPVASAAMLPLMKPALSRTVTVILYHDIDPELFRSHLAFYRKNYSVIPLRQYAACLNDQTENSLPDNSLIITMDDGWKRNRDLLPAIIENNVPVTIFLCAELMDSNRKIWNYTLAREGSEKALNTKLKALPTTDKNRQLLEHNGHFPEKEYEDRSLLNFDEIEQMSRHVDFQSHGLMHEVLEKCTEEQLEAEVFQSARLLKEKLKSDIFAFAFPYGRRDSRCIDAVQRAGYKVARTSNIPTLNSANIPTYELKSLGVPDSATLSELKNIISWGKLRFLYNNYLKSR